MGVLGPHFHDDVTGYAEPALAPAPQKVLLAAHLPPPPNDLEGKEQIYVPEDKFQESVAALASTRSSWCLTSCAS